MQTIKAQKIVVFLRINENDKNLILNGIRIAYIFKKELCLFYHQKKEKGEEIEKIRATLSTYIDTVGIELPGLPVSSLILNKSMEELPDLLADDYEAIILLADAARFSDYSKALAESPVPFLFIHGKTQKVFDFKKLVVPFDLRKECSESAIWASHFGRFNQAAVVVVAATHSWKEEQNEVTRHVAFAKKLFQKFKIEHKIFRGNTSSLRITFEALDLALSAECDLLVILGSSVITPLDLLIGLPENKIMKKAGELPVLVINPAKDNYLLCD